MKSDWLQTQFNDHIIYPDETIFIVLQNMFSIIMGAKIYSTNKKLGIEENSKYPFSFFQIFGWKGKDHLSTYKLYY